MIIQNPMMMDLEVGDHLIGPGSIEWIVEEVRKTPLLQKLTNGQIYYVTANLYRADDPSQKSVTCGYGHQAVNMSIVRNREGGGM